MTEHQIVNYDPERAYLVGANPKGSIPLLPIEDSLDELALLARTAGMTVVGRSWQNVQQIDPATFIGSGKVEEIREDVEATDAQVIIFDDELSPRHQRELEKRFGEQYKLLDRSALILDIFAQHAHTREGTLQVELAQYEYRLPRLTRQWTHLARQAGGGSARGGTGGVGLRGPGETQLEVDRREIGRKISKLKVDLENVRAHRGRYREQRTRARIPVIALVGYTNAGKSTLFRSLTGSDVYVADQLFATLDPTTRRVELPSGRHVLLTDTVGFIQKLPTTLIAAFRATLEEVTEADVILHVVDASHHNVLQHIEAVEDTLAELDVPPVPELLVWNKVDLIEESERPTLDDADEEYAASAYISALTGEGLEHLLEQIENAIARSAYHVRFLLPYDRGEVISHLHETSTVESQEHTEDGVIITTQISPDLYERYKEYEI
ncbi:MAG: GTPase HflX [Anaerolineae bacterium]|nr:GTPase HflX [Anaerolineae bacterium]